MASSPGSSSGSGSNRARTRPRDGHDDFPPLSAPRLPPLRNMHWPLESPSRQQPRFWSAAARRAERIRRLGDQGLDDAAQAPEQSPWLDASRRSLGLRPVDGRRRPNLDELDQTLDEANSQLRSLLDMSNHINLVAPPVMRHALSPMPPPYGRLGDDSPRSKRRKIDSDRLAPSPGGFRYGKYGQVEPGQLHMEIVSCDGGIFSNESSYAADNILRDDGSVYCTKGSRCNIILRHEGATVFTLRELVIKAPGSINYSHP